MVNKWNNINKTKETLKVMDNKWNNINKTKETLNSDGQQVEQYK